MVEYKHESDLLSQKMYGDQELPSDSNGVKSVQPDVDLSYAAAEDINDAEAAKVKSAMEALIITFDIYCRQQGILMSKEEVQNAHVQIEGWAKLQLENQPNGQVVLDKTKLQELLRLIGFTTST